MTAMMWFLDKTWLSSDHLLQRRRQGHHCPRAAGGLATSSPFKGPPNAPGSPQQAAPVWVAG
eukprot:10677084-Lingulodinium_polyedra.AAC.1